ncbi:MAG: hypothetical protein J6Q22_09770 [Prevotella sp.]|nr:hypothetical protein [Prevotella sp.]
MKHIEGREEGKEIEIVSMRCCRHKKRFNVPRCWVDKCDWLCPRCYEKLSEEERGKYSPKNVTAVSMRKAEDGKPTIYPLSGTVKDSNLRCHSIEKKRTYRKNHIENLKRLEKSRMTSAPCTYSLQDLMPLYKIECKKCGQTVKCHYSWFDNSTVLCPECYCRMGKGDIEIFHKAYRAEKPKMISARRPLLGESSSGLMTPVYSKNFGWTKDAFRVNSGGGWSSSHIMTASEKELKAAVNQGKVSAARYRIEMNRRRNEAYYNLFPDSPGRRVVFR